MLPLILALLGLISLVLMAWAVHGSVVAWRRDPEQWRAIKAGMPSATASAIILGFFAALAASWLQSKADHRQQTQEAARVASEERSKELVLVRGNIADNLMVIDGVNAHASRQDFVSWLLSSPLRVRFWAGLVDSGGLKVIADPALVATLSDTYEKADQCGFVYQLLLNSEYGPTAIFSGTDAKTGEQVPLHNILEAQMQSCYQRARMDFVMADAAVVKALALEAARRF